MFRIAKRSLVIFIIAALLIVPLASSREVMPRQRRLSARRGRVSVSDFTANRSKMRIRSPFGRKHATDGRERR